MRLRQLFEAPSTAVMAFGRMNPPTIGHEKLVNKIKSLPGDPYIFLSQSQKPKTDPLSFEDKLRYAKFFFPEVTIGNPEVKTIIQALQKINQLGYKNLIYVAGSDRVQAFEEMINKYNGQPDKEGNVTYQFDTIKVVSAGERDPDADGAEGMSASKMRAAAASGDIDSFRMGVPNQAVADEMFASVRKGMGVKDLEPAEGVAEANYGRYWCSTDKKWKTRKGPKQSRKVSESIEELDAEYKAQGANWKNVQKQYDVEYLKTTRGGLADYKTDHLSPEDLEVVQNAYQQLKDAWIALSRAKNPPNPRADADARGYGKGRYTGD